MFALRNHSLSRIRVYSLVLVYAMSEDRRESEASIWLWRTVEAPHRRLSPRWIFQFTRGRGYAQNLKFCDNKKAWNIFLGCTLDVVFSTTNNESKDLIPSLVILDIE
jgi:hypothetical protein